MIRFPPGPWVVVVGMHRSGTSAVTGALVSLGLNMARSEDLMDWPDSNPEHWESLSATRFNDGLLARLGGGWDAPPDLPVGWEHSPDLLAVGDPAELMAAAYPDQGPSVWKDPRLCLLLPYWRDRIPTPVAAVFVTRSPLAVARSLQRRDGMSVVDGLALWERYNRCAVAGLAGVATYVVDYETVLDDPSGFVRQLVGWLDSHHQFGADGRTWDTESAVASIAGGLRHQPSGRTPDDDALLLAEQHELVEYLTGLAGVHSPLPAPPPAAESAWTTDVIRLRRNKFPQTKQIELLTEQRRIAEYLLAIARADIAESNRLLEDVYASTSWRLTKPLRSSISSLQSLRHHADEP